MATTPTRPTHTDRPTGTLSAWEGMARQYDYWLTVYKRTWRGGVIGSFATPLFYVVAMGVLLGGFIDADPGRLEGATSYLAFIVPGLVAAHAMTIAVSESTYPVMGAIKWHKTFFAQLATPLAVRDLVNAFVAFVVFRVASACAVFMLVLAPFGVFESWWGPLLAWVAQVLVGTAFALLTFGYSRAAQVRGGLRRPLPPRRAAADALLGRVLPDHQPRPGARVGRPADAAVARRLAVADVLPRHRRLVAGRHQRRRAGRPLRRRLALVGHRPRQAAGGLMATLDRVAIPAPLTPAHAARVLVLRNFIVYKSAWKLFLTGFLEPVLYLFSIGIGVGQLIDSFEFHGEQVPYAAFVAPAMLATSAFNGALLDSTFNVFFKLKYEKLYDQMLATPLTTGDIARGEIAWGLLEETIGASLARTVAAYADREALVECASGWRWTWAELDRDVDDVARGLIGAGIEKGDRVGIWGPNSAEWTLVQLATAKVGAILVNVNPSYRTHEFAYVVNQSGMRFW